MDQEKWSEAKRIGLKAKKVFGNEYRIVLALEVIEKNLAPFNSDVG